MVHATLTSGTAAVQRLQVGIAYESFALPRGLLHQARRPSGKRRRQVFTGGHPSGVFAFKRLSCIYYG